MEFEDFFESKRKQYGNYNKPRYPNDDRYPRDPHASVPSHDNRFGGHREDGYEDVRYQHASRSSGHGHEDNLVWVSLLDKIRSNKKLKIFVILAAFVVLVIAILLIAAFLPLLVKLYNYIAQNGLQGIQDWITGLLDKILKGSGK
jgi:hypothetical protein